ncbi:ADP-ribose pyrophosphatase, putative [Babesia caballi]|uniref:ADP-ribose pyrophosphatase, putative n=1 Tax=Babesia caballi TaxID=5871 RepID=A0AAV4M1A2_BABCB|nr:ADP-ribose pyrophosphatase, putative [Babesia caballi]
MYEARECRLSARRGRTLRRSRVSHGIGHASRGWLEVEGGWQRDGVLELVQRLHHGGRLVLDKAGEELDLHLVLGLGDAQLHVGGPQRAEGAQQRRQAHCGGAAAARHEGLGQLAVESLHRGDVEDGLQPLHGHVPADPEYHALAVVEQVGVALVEAGASEVEGGRDGLVAARVAVDGEVFDGHGANAEPVVAAQVAGDVVLAEAGGLEQTEGVHDELAHGVVHGTQRREDVGNASAHVLQLRAAVAELALEGEGHAHLSGDVGRGLGVEGEEDVSAVVAHGDAVGAHADEAFATGIGHRLPRHAVVGDEGGREGLVDVAVGQNHEVGAPDHAVSVKLGSLPARAEANAHHRLPPGLPGDHVANLLRELLVAQLGLEGHVVHVAGGFGEQRVERGEVYALSGADEKLDGDLRVGQDLGVIRTPISRKSVVVAALALFQSTAGEGEIAKVAGGSGEDAELASNLHHGVGSADRAAHAAAGLLVVLPRGRNEREQVQKLSLGLRNVHHHALGQGKEQIVEVGHHHDAQVVVGSGHVVKVDRSVVGDDADHRTRSAGKLALPNEILQRLSKKSRKTNRNGLADDLNHATGHSRVGHFNGELSPC